jgi:hypothetical protein
VRRCNAEEGITAANCRQSTNFSNGHRTHHHDIFLNLNVTYILYHVSLFCTMSHFWESGPSSVWPWRRALSTVCIEPIRKKIRSTPEFLLCGSGIKSYRYPTSGFRDGSCGTTDTISLCVHFMHFVQGSYKFQTVYRTPLIRKMTLTVVTPSPPFLCVIWKIFGSIRVFFDVVYCNLSSFLFGPCFNSDVGQCLKYGATHRTDLFCYWNSIV